MYLPRRRALVGRGSITARDRNVEQTQINPELRAMMREVGEHRTPEQLRPRGTEHLLAAELHRPRRHRLIPRHLLYQSPEFPAHLVEDLNSLGAARGLGLGRPSAAIVFIPSQHQDSETG